MFANVHKGMYTYNGYYFVHFLHLHFNLSYECLTVDEDDDGLAACGHGWQLSRARRGRQSDVLAR